MTEKITSTSNTRVKYAHNLQNRPRLRRGDHKLVLEGARLIRDALQQGARFDFVLYDPEATDYELIALLQNRHVSLNACSSDVIKFISDTQQPQGMIAVSAIPVPSMPAQARRVLVLDAIREPGNMGTMLRTAGAAGIDLVILAPTCVDPYNPKAMRAGMGAHFRLPIVEASWSEIKGFIQPLHSYIAAGNSSTLYSDVDWTQPWALVIGNEAHGAGSATGSLDAELISIPMAMETESLNAAIAGSVILFEAQRQRLAKS